MLKFGNTFVNFGGETYLTGYTKYYSGWHNIYSPVSGLFLPTNRNITGYYSANVPSSMNRGESWLDGTQDMMVYGLGVPSNQASNKTVSGHVSGYSDITLSEEDRRYNDYMLLNYSISPWECWHGTISNIIPSVPQYAYIDFNEGRITHRCSTDINSKGLKKPDGHNERKSWYYSFMSGNTVLYTSSYQTYFSPFHRDVKNVRVLYDINNGDYSAYMTSSMIENFSALSAPTITGVGSPLSWNDKLRFGINLIANTTHVGYSRDDDWYFRGWYYGGFSISSYKGPTPTQNEVLSL